ncbi:hypothetical protein BS47DRAFT_1378169 [Hydnum rufescens UP504]|uniref:ClpP/crotonase n=1 Tax=Hydnum rufescens UP504 TaxID=1448309 RepID=A0A9P6DP88_9AGAM|nr:hypothetical protein BS47DRAFT_1378169 [Hydnum rufescens UP504]
MPYPIRLPIGSPAPLESIHHPTHTTWELEMHHGVDNRINHEFIDEVFLKALDLVERDWRSSTSEVGAPGALIIVGQKSQQKFFSNGLDYEGISKGPGFFTNYFDVWIRRLIDFPMPIIAAINGHCFAAAFVLALACDYRVMTSGKAWCCLNELEVGAPLRPSVATLLNYKFPSPKIVRDATLDARRFTPQELHALGVIDVLADGGTDGLAEAKAPRAKTGVYGLMRTDMMKDVFNATKLDERRILAVDAAALARRQLDL